MSDKFMPVRAPNGASQVPITAGFAGSAVGPGHGLPMASAPSVPGRDTPNTLVDKTMKTGRGAGASKGLREGFLGGSTGPGYAFVAKT